MKVNDDRVSVIIDTPTMKELRKMQGALMALGLNGVNKVTLGSTIAQALVALKEKLETKEK